MKPITLLISFMTFVLCMGLNEYTVHAQSSENNQSLFKTIDTDQNKKLTMDEFSAHFFKVSFSYLDKNGDGKINKTEWLMMETQDDASAMFNKLDSDHDGFITIQEFSHPPDKREIVDNLFQTLDKNEDGVLEEDELRWK
ncbi:EF-hand domain-containing protein [Desulfococcaceae bacterium HSG7]|nr:EF-hand domain-containing protein [Desulfococcaceae bacterium HSG9]MDM8555976.1 EF-hand domain-containing protein [Desulfococcaceae bacterium HSG7]